MTATPPTDAQPGVRRYRRRPVDVEAAQVTEENVEAVADWMADHGIDLVATLAGDHKRISWGGQGNTGPGTATVGDIVIRVNGGFSVETEPSRFAERHQDCAYPPAQTDEAIAALFADVVRVVAQSTAPAALYDRAVIVADTLNWLRGQGGRPFPTTAEIDSLDAQKAAHAHPA